MSSSHSLTFVDLHPASDCFLDDVIAGLARTPKSLSPKYFYDDRGSALFEAICELPEYYPTRTELALMREHVGAMAASLGAGCRACCPHGRDAPLGYLSSIGTDSCTYSKR